MKISRVYCEEMQSKRRAALLICTTQSERDEAMAVFFHKPKAIKRRRPCQKETTTTTTIRRRSRTVFPVNWPRPFVIEIRRSDRPRAATGTAERRTSVAHLHGRLRFDACSLRPPVRLSTRACRHHHHRTRDRRGHVSIPNEIKHSVGAGSLLTLYCSPRVYCLNLVNPLFFCAVA